jgi:CRP/FNR family transcriptional regulator, cyclic AMP receptor protein
VIIMVLLDMLEEVNFLKDIPAEFLGYIASIGELKEYPAGAVLFQEGKESDYVFLVLSGKVELEMRVGGVGGMPIQTVAAGELLGWSPLLRLGPMTATGHTLSRCRLVALPVRQLLELCDREPHFGMEFLRRTAATEARRLRATRHRLLGLVSVAGGGTSGVV